MSGADVGAVVDPDRTGAGGYVDAADIILADPVYSDAETADTCGAEAAFEQCAQPVHVDFSVRGADSGVVLFEADGRPVVCHPDQQRATPAVEHARHGCDDCLRLRLVPALFSCVTECWSACTRPPAIPHGSREFPWSRPR